MPARSISIRRIGGVTGDLAVRESRRHHGRGARPGAVGRRARRWPRSATATPRASRSGSTTPHRAARGARPGRGVGLGVGVWGGALPHRGPHGLVLGAVRRRPGAPVRLAAACPRRVAAPAHAVGPGGLRSAARRGLGRTRGGWARRGWTVRSTSTRGSSMASWACPCRPPARRSRPRRPGSGPRSRAGDRRSGAAGFEPACSPMEGVQRPLYHDPALAAERTRGRACSRKRGRGGRIRTGVLLHAV